MQTWLGFPIEQPNAPASLATYTTCGTCGTCGADRAAGLSRVREAEGRGSAGAGAASVKFSGVAGRTTRQLELHQRGGLQHQLPVVDAGTSATERLVCEVLLLFMGAAPSATGSDLHRGQVRAMPICLSNSHLSTQSL